MMGQLIKSRASIFFVSLAVIFLLAFILLLTCIEISAFDLNFYSAEYEKLKRPEAIGISEQELMEVTQALLDYIRGKRPDLNVKAVIKGQERYVFNQREIAHMIDVRELFMKGYQLRRVLIIGFIFFLIILYILTKADMIRWLFKAYLLLLMFLVLIGGALLVLINEDFTPYWNYFHYIFFDNDLWLLNPQTDILIQIVPEQFFYDIVIRIITHFILGMLAVGVLLGGICVWLERLKWKQG
jgi:integral membrane protein (TIGR01906 family)